MADGRISSAEGPPAKKPKTASPAVTPGYDSSDIGSLLSKFNQELPDELGSLVSSSPLPATATQNGSDRRADDTIQKNRNLSELLNSETFIPRANPNMFPPMATRYQPNIRYSPVVQPQQRMNSGMRQMMQMGSVPSYSSGAGLHMGPRGQVPVGYPMRHPADIPRPTDRKSVV